MIPYKETLKNHTLEKILGENNKMTDVNEFKDRLQESKKKGKYPDLKGFIEVAGWFNDDNTITIKLGQYAKLKPAEKPEEK